MICTKDDLPVLNKVKLCHQQLEISKVVFDLKKPCISYIYYLPASQSQENKIDCAYV